MRVKQDENDDSLGIFDLLDNNGMLSVLISIEWGDANEYTQHIFS